MSLTAKANVGLKNYNLKYFMLLGESDVRKFKSFSNTFEETEILKKDRITTESMIF